MIVLEPGIIGFNSPMGALGEPRGSYASGDMDRALSLLPVRALRFPGGTVANYFDWETGSLMEEALERSGREKLVDNQRKARERNKGILPPVDFGSFHTVTEEHGIRRFVVLNLLTSPIESTIVTIDRIKKEYPGQYYWELGNELSQGSYRGRAFATDAFNESVYVRLANRIAAHIEAHYPEDRVGLVVGQLIEGRTPAVRKFRNLQEQRAEWDRAVAGVDHADAVIIHPYVELDKRLPMSQARSLMKELPGMTRKAQVQWRWMFACAQELPGLYVQRLENRFPDRKIWITEAGLANDSDARNALAQAHDMSRVLFDVAYFISWLRVYPAWETFLYHGLFPGKRNMAAFAADMGWNANTVAYVFLERLLEQGRAIAVMDISDSPEYHGTGFYADRRVRALTGAYVSTDDGDRILLVNTGPEPVEVRIPFAGMSTVTAGGAHDAEVDVADFDDAELFRRVSGISGAVAVPAYSVVLISESVRRDNG